MTEPVVRSPRPPRIHVPTAQHGLTETGSQCHVVDCSCGELWQKVELALVDRLAIGRTGYYDRSDTPERKALDAAIRDKVAAALAERTIAAIDKLREQP